MKIENIIDDIKKDIIELGEKLKEQFRKENPGLNFSITLPRLEELTTIKSIALTIEEDNILYYLSAYVHTQNGNRVFENAPLQIINDSAAPCFTRHPIQDRFVTLLREVIRKNKNKR